MSGCTPDRAPDHDWEQFRTLFIRPDGRLVDPARNDLTHSEGQGIALLLAVHYDDPATFAAVWGWTQTHLQTRSDRLLSWSWSPESGINDHNNATDGDLLVAWALARGGRRWDTKTYLEAAQAMGRDIRQKLVRTDRRGPVLLPGMVGFEQPGHLVLNLSYWVFPAMTELAVLDPAPEWQALRASGIALLKESRFGRWGLPADWIELGDKPVLASAFPGRFGYDAVRIPLYLLWAGLDEPSLLEPYRSFWGHFAGAGFLPAWTNLVDDSVDSYDAPPGMRAVARVTIDAPDGPATDLPALAADSPYYSAALLLLCKVMLAERDR